MGKSRRASSPGRGCVWGLATFGLAPDRAWAAKPGTAAVDAPATRSCLRFMAMAEGNLENGFSKISTNLDMAARNLGRSQFQTLRIVLLPLLRPAIAGAVLLVFVDVVKLALQIVQSKTIDVFTFEREIAEKCKMGSGNLSNTHSFCFCNALHAKIDLIFYFWSWKSWRKI